MATPIIVTYRQEAIWATQMPHSREGRFEFSKQFIYKVTFNVIETSSLAAALRNSTRVYVAFSLKLQTELPSPENTKGTHSRTFPSWWLFANWPSSLLPTTLVPARTADHWSTTVVQMKVAPTPSAELNQKTQEEAVLSFYLLI